MENLETIVRSRIPAGTLYSGGVPIPGGDCHDPLLAVYKAPPCLQGGQKNDLTLQIFLTMIFSIIFTFLAPLLTPAYSSAGVDQTQLIINRPDLGPSQWDLSEALGFQYPDIPVGHFLDALGLYYVDEDD